MSERRILFLVNPVAGKGRAVEALPRIKERMSEHPQIHYEVYVSTAPGDITRSVREHEAAGYRELIAVGGDGTISEMVNGLDFERPDRSVIGVIPTGRGNDFVRNFDHTDFDCVMDAIIERRLTPVDIGRVNGYYFLNSCSFGIDGPITIDAFRLKKQFPGELSYLIATLRQLVKYRARRVHLCVDGDESESEVLLAAISNGRYFGGGMKVAPSAELDDGMLDLCIVRRVSPLKFLFCFPKIYRGRLDSIREVSYRRFESLSIRPLGDAGLMINVDGNIIGSAPAEISIQRRAVQVFGVRNGK